MQVVLKRTLHRVLLACAELPPAPERGLMELLSSSAEGWALTPALGQWFCLSVDA